jgi:hypothetical protein
MTLWGQWILLREKLYFLGTCYNVSLRRLNHSSSYVMARALYAGSGDAFTCRTSELRWKETDPQPDRVEFKQVMSSFCVDDALTNGFETAKTTPTRTDLFDEPDMTTMTIPCYLYDLLFGSKPKAYLLVPLKIQQMWLKN